MLVALVRVVLCHPRMLIGSNNCGIVRPCDDEALEEPKYHARS
jgi:hypothetical protein